MTTENLIGLGAGIITGFSMVPQLIKVLREKKRGNLSPLTIAILLLGLVLWIWYGFLKKDLPILITNGFSALVNLALLISCFVWKNR
ncbi:SemiSWEET family sugar transporter [Sediminibacterium ginsengisoli]|uniref:MtN3 and saliva related transmembrane protein n=1 Tax=Sediminibacterium ginsengisoli TaxID=413434 RepID=A0A1T4P7L3_9BACT|nr:SemiSWEET family transporter [Sediminibacterium ginsengisoli]SJZ87565.1 MtN3 and saliva related transmembrane protein [Sediminibacterium ginsengisoli]